MGINIQESNLSFSKRLSYSNNPKEIILHHAEWSKCSVNDIHNCHLNKGWSGIGYHFFVRKDGTIFRGRPENAIGAHCYGHNVNTLGVCAEGAYMTETMPEVQKQAIINLCIYLKNKYGITSIHGHKEKMSTDCPGARYPLSEIKSKVLNGQSCQVIVSSAKPQSAVASGTWRNYIYGDIVKELQHELNSQFNAGIREDGYFGDATINKLIICKQGAKGNISRIIQKRLIALGYSCGSYGADGSFGKGTYDAVVRFQKNKGLSADGIVGKDTFKALFHR